MNISEIVQSKGWQKFMAKVYGWGAAVVILGALFKINHYPFAGELLLVGLSTEALIFFLSAFEPLHEQYDWSLVYPELAGLGEDEESELSGETRHKGGGGSAFDILLEKSEVGDEVIEKLGEGIQNLANTASTMADVSKASLATKDYVENVTSASESMNTLSQSSIQTAEIVNKSGESYQQLASKITEDYQTVAEGGKNYGQEIGKLNKNLSSLNSAFELQIKGSDEYWKKAEEAQKGLGNIMTNLSASVEATEKYKKEVTELGKKLESLNTVYGNMLSAMNLK